MKLQLAKVLTAYNRSVLRRLDWRFRLLLFSTLGRCARFLDTAQMVLVEKIDQHLLRGSPMGMMNGPGRFAVAAFNGIQNTAVVCV